MKNLLKNKWVIIGASLILFVLIATAISGFLAFFYLKSEKEYITASDKAYKEVNKAVQDNLPTASKYKEIIDYIYNEIVVKPEVTEFTYEKYVQRLNDIKFEPVSANLVLDIPFTSLPKTPEKLSNLEKAYNNYKSAVKNHISSISELKKFLPEIYHTQCDKPSIAANKRIAGSGTSSRREEIIKEEYAKLYNSLNNIELKNSSLVKIRDHFISFCKKQENRYIEYHKFVSTTKGITQAQNDQEFDKYKKDRLEFTHEYVKNEADTFTEFTKDIDSTLSNAEKQYIDEHNKAIKDFGSNVKNL